ncbi:MAG: DNA repair protein RecO [Luteitalea sp.]|nr:DNA repair protein RecO [Luteitalea sp.]
MVDSRPWRRGTGVISGAGGDAMPLYSGEALVLRTYKLGEADRIVVFLTRDRGKKRGVAKGARRVRSRFLGALEPLTRVSIAYYEREHRELVRLGNAEPLRSPLAAQQPDAFGYAAYFAALLDEWLPEGDVHERVYRLGITTLDALTEDVALDALARYFEYWLLRLQGVYPSIEHCARCRRDLGSAACLVARDHSFLCARCAPGEGGVAVSTEAFDFLRRSARVPPAALGGVPLGPRAVRELDAAHRALLAWHLEKDPKPGRVLREIQPER